MKPLFVLLLATRLLPGESVTASGSVSIQGAVRAKSGHKGAVIWLKPAGGAMTAAPRHERILQRQKRFEPHLLVVPVGSVVDFPNFDPFFHNVFSLFDGKKFDLGLYEAGASRSVTFSRTGFCFVFCNIHPEMSAVVVVVDSPYYAVSGPDGEFRIPQVPAGKYVLSVWHERAKPENAAEYPREVRVSHEGASLGTIRLMDAGPLLAPHKNKYGRDYDPASAAGSALYR